MTQQPILDSLASALMPTLKFVSAAGSEQTDELSSLRGRLRSAERLIEAERNGEGKCRTALTVRSPLKALGWLIQLSPSPPTPAALANEDRSDRGRFIRGRRSGLTSASW
jgi:hypothetical protein